MVGSRGVGDATWDVFQDERASLMELRGPFDGFVEKAVRATTTCLIMTDHNRYSVDARAAGRMVLVRSHAEVAGLARVRASSGWMPPTSKPAAITYRGHSVAIRCGSERPRRSSFQTIGTSPSRT